MFGLDTIFLLGVGAITGAAAAAGNNNRNRNNDRQGGGPPPNTYQVSSYSESSGASSSVHANPGYLEKRTIWDWGCNGLENEERDILLGWGYEDRGIRYELIQLKGEVKYRERNLLTAESQTYIQVWMDENDYSSGEERRKKERVVNPSKKKSPVGRGLRKGGRDRYGKRIKTNDKTGNDKRYYQGDDRHNDIEVYDRNGKHLGSMDPRLGTIYKAAKGYILKF